MVACEDCGHLNRQGSKNVKMRSSIVAMALLGLAACPRPAAATPVTEAMVQAHVAAATQAAGSGRPGTTG